MSLLIFALRGTCLNMILRRADPSYRLTVQVHLLKSHLSFLSPSSSKMYKIFFLFGVVILYSM